MSHLGRYYANAQNGYAANQQMMYTMQQTQAAMAAGMPTGPGGTRLPFSPLSSLHLRADQESMDPLEAPRTVPRPIPPTLLHKLVEGTRQ